MPEDYGLLSYLGWRKFVNRAKRALRTPLPWIVGITYGTIAVLLDRLASSPTHPGTRPTDLSQYVPGLEGLLLVVLGFLSLYSIPTAALVLVDQDEFVTVVYGSPISPYSILRLRLLKTWVLVAVVWAVGSVGAVLAFGGAYNVPEPVLAVRLVLGAVPILMSWVLAGLLIAYYERTPASWYLERILLVVTLAVVGAFLAGVPPNMSGFPALANDLVVKQLLNSLGPLARWVAGAALGPGDAAVLAGSWAVAGLLTFLVWRLPYPTPGTFRSPSTPPLHQLTPEVPLPDSWMTRLRERLRPRYRDLGVGADAVRGEVWTLSLRAGEIWMGGLFVVMLLVVAAPFAATEASGRVFVTLVLLSLGMAFGLLCVGIGGVTYWNPLIDQARQSPASSRAIALAILAPRVVVGGAVAAAIAFSTSVATLDPILGLLAGGVVGSVLALFLCIDLLGSPKVGASLEGVRFQSSSKGIYTAGLLLLVILPESLLTAFAPSPDSWDPLYWPLAAELVANTVLVWVLLDRAARHLAAPAES